MNCISTAYQWKICASVDELRGEYLNWTLAALFCRICNPDISVSLFLSPHICNFSIIKKREVLYKVTLPCTDNKFYPLVNLHADSIHMIDPGHRLVKRYAKVFE